MTESKESIFSWPALEIFGELPEVLQYERGIWGKVHGASSDFRWIAVTPSFNGQEKAIERRLQLGQGSTSTPIPLWHAIGNTCYAVHCYPSRAMDASARSDFLEKQMFEWRRPVEIPALLGALVLLPQVFKYKQEIWWETFSDPKWLESTYVLRLQQADYMPLPVSLETIRFAIEYGRKSLVEAMSEEMLCNFYAALLAGQKTVVLDEFKHVLQPEALTALLLPLPRDKADTLSMTGGLPSGRLDAEQLRQHWSILVNNTGTPLPSEKKPVPTAAQRQRAEQMTQALVTGDPALLKKSPPKLSSSQQSTAAASARPMQLVLWGPSAAGKTVFLGRLYIAALEDEDWDMYPTDSSIVFSEKMREQMDSNNIFPAATEIGQVDQIVYTFCNRKTGVEVSLSVEDRAGGDFEQLNDEARQRLASADGLVLLFDPLRSEADLVLEVSLTIQKIYLARKNAVKQDERPIAVCISKADLLIGSLEDYRDARDHPDEFVQEQVPPILLKELDQYCKNYRLFPVSAAGLHIRYGAIEPTVFYDENLVLRICAGGYPFNLLAPFSWLTEELSP
ncbi:MAG: hypothetical protein GY862_27540 [Gammaproteobacteria bacterium]|nr:hypothetical protein [Gammaproteobacteria bacterium]